MNKINTKEASENYWKERVKNNDYSDKERNDYFLCRYVNYDWVKLNIKKELWKPINANNVILNENQEHK